LEFTGSIVEGREYVTDGESVEMWARFDGEGYLWLDFVIVCTMPAEGVVPGWVASAVPSKG
jgi:hypothetical protein